jgi:HD-like signal output (HDOD) protein
MFDFIKNFLTKNTSKRHSTIVIDRLPSTLEKEIFEPEWFSAGALFEDITPQTPPSSSVKITLTGVMRGQLRDYIKEVMPEPCASLKIYHELNSREHTTNEMSVLIGSDPLLAARILKTANSAAYSFISEVTYVGRAITLLGINEIKSIVLAQSIRMSTEGFKGNPQFAEKIRVHSAMVSSVAQNLSFKNSNLNRFEMATIGLLHDIGKILYDEILKSGKKLTTSQNIPQLEIEAIVASVFAEFWGLSSKICEALEFIPYPIFYPISEVDEALVPLITTIASANFIANATGFSDSDPLYNIREEYLLASNFSLEPEQWLNREIVMEIEKARLSLI